MSIFQVMKHSFNIHFLMAAYYFTVSNNLFSQPVISAHSGCYKHLHPKNFKYICISPRGKCVEVELMSQWIKIMLRPLAFISKLP